MNNRNKIKSYITHEGMTMNGVYFKPTDKERRVIKKKTEHLTIIS